MVAEDYTEKYEIKRIEIDEALDYIYSGAVELLYVREKSEGYEISVDTNIHLVSDINISIDEVHDYDWFTISRG